MEEYKMNSANLLELVARKFLNYKEIKLHWNWLTRTENVSEKATNSRLITALKANRKVI